MFLRQPGWVVLAWAGVAAAVIGFYQPWAELDIMRHSQTEKELSGGIRRGLSKSFGITSKKEPSWIRQKKTPALVPTRITGAMIPTLAHRKNVKVLLQLAALMTRQPPPHETVGTMSYAVYGAPGLAMLLAVLLSTAGLRWRAVGAPALLLGAAVAAGGCALLLTSNRGREYGIVIGSGLWLTLAGYGLLAAAGAARLLPRHA